ncbi:MAG: ACT domain-containing protein [Erysipelothrix sp.]|nr:ACT domain-containing protein [Erysipelothrix sp.]
MKTIITVVGLDQVGIIAGVCNLLAKHKVNVLDINQTILDEFFNMIMIVDIEDSDLDFETLNEALTSLEKTLNVKIQIQQESIFKSMHRI